MTSADYRIRCLLLAALLFATLAAIWLIQPFICSSDYTICFFRTVTGKPCVFCGLTRAFAYAMHGNLDSAFACNKFWWLAALITLCLAFFSLLDATGKTALMRRLGNFRSTHAWYLAGAVIILTLIRILFTSA